MEALSRSERGKMAKIWRSQEYELLDSGRASSDSSGFGTCSDRERDFENDTTRKFDSQSIQSLSPSWRFWTLRIALQTCQRLRRRRHRRPQRRQCLFWTAWVVASIPWVLVFLVYFTAIFLPSYTNWPEHYRVLERRCKNSTQPGRGNPNNEKVFLAASIYDHNGTLLAGRWGNAVAELVQLLGPQNVHLSVYENDPNDAAKASLAKLGSQLNCEFSIGTILQNVQCSQNLLGNVSLVAEHLPLEEIPRITTPNGEKRMKRIAFLSEVRNRALRPLEAATIQFDKLLFINDVIFDPIEAVQLLLSTNVDSNGRTQYGAVCAVDFINAFKFYDTFATRDLEGYEMGMQFFPWFADAGDAATRQDVMAQKDAVRVRSCWGGMTAFEASWFQKPLVDKSTRYKGKPSAAKTPHSPLRFRSEEDPFWEASEVCIFYISCSPLLMDISQVGRYSKRHPFQCFRTPSPRNFFVKQY